MQTDRSRGVNVIPRVIIAQDAVRAPVVSPRQTRAEWLSRHGVEVAVVVALVALSTALHAHNMFGFPYYENDEGTYVSRAWNFITTGELDVYTYRYDHAPAGWMLLGLWFALTGGDLLFGSLLESGRVLMLLLHVASTVMLYLIARRLSGGMTAGVIAVLIFAVSPLGIYFQRRVLLDNIMVFWILLAILLLLRRQLTLSAVVMSGILFGVAVLTKLNAVFFGLGFLVLIWMQSAAHQRRHALAMWLAFAGGTVVLLVLYAALNEELLSAPLGLDGAAERVSFVDTMSLQLGRGNSLPPWDADSSIRSAFDSWMLKDTVTPLLGLFGVVGLATLAIVHRGRRLQALALLLLMLGYLGFLIRGGIVIDLYIAPAIPIFALGTGLACAAVVRWLRPRALRVMAGCTAVGAVAVAFVAFTDTRHFSVDEVTNQQAALEWIDKNIDPSAVIASDNYAFPSLAQENRFANTLYFFNAEYDPESRELYRDDWRNVDYLLVTHEFIQQAKQGTIPGLREAFDRAELIASFTAGSSSFIDLPSYRSTNGDWAQVYKVKDRNEIVLQDSWNFFVGNFMHDYGRVAGRSAASLTTTSDQLVGMAQALHQADEAGFRGIWQWSRDHLQHRQNDALLSAQWVVNSDGRGALSATSAVCRADQAIGELLLRGAQVFDDERLGAEGRILIDDWWASCVVERDGLMLVDSTTEGSVVDDLLNLSTFDPPLYRRLMAFMPQHDWQRLIDDGYSLVERVLRERGTVPNWVVLTDEGQLASAAALVEGDPDSFGGETLRLIRSLVLDEAAGNGRPGPILDVLQPQLEEYWLLNRALPASTTLALFGQVRDYVIDPRTIYRDDIAAAYTPETGEWGSRSSLSDHYWGWAWHDAQRLIPEDARIALE
jgi:4-amino-4-deoxy-L-arabinose transferase-like glycosyltransferase